MTEAARVNKLIAEFMRATHGTWELAGGGFGYTGPDYWNSADAVLPVVERICRERGLTLHAAFVDEEWTLEFAQYDGIGCVTVVEQTCPTLSTAAALACAAVIEAKTERTEP